MNSLPTVLIVDDEPRSLEALRRILEDDFLVRTAATVAEAQAILGNDWVQIVLCDQRMPEISGVEFLKVVQEKWPDVVRMIISGYTDAHDIIRAVNEAGIYQYVTKPWQPDSLILTLKNAARLFTLQRENELLAVELKMSSGRAEQVMAGRRKALREQYHYDDGIVRATSSPLNHVCDTLRQVAPYDVSVLLMGKSGTGKELAARALHYNSLRWNKPFVVENCAAMPDQLLESELFGHKRGSFTGATDDHIGLFERADGGTVFLDEIGEVSPAFQVKLLRVLQEGEIRPVGSNRTRKVDVRVIAATNRDLVQEVSSGRFREDLYYRIAVVTIEMPPLRERPDDIPVLAKSLLEKAMTTLGKRVTGLGPETLACLKAYHWPGNVRELQNELQHMLVIGPEGNELGAHLLSPRILRATPSAANDDVDGGELLFGNLSGSLKDRVDRMEARILREALIRNRWNKSRAAKELGLSRVGLRAKLERYGLERVDAAKISEMMEK